MKGASERLRSSNAVMCPGAPMSTLKSLLVESSLELPDDHLTLLSESNGITGFHGYVRLFGLGCESCVDLRQWNDRETWKFAWKNDDLGSFVCFGETAWGDQYAYRVEELRAGGESVYFLDAFEMEPEVIAKTFEEFVEGELARYSAEPYDKLVVAAYHRFGDLGWSDHITYIPSLLLGGEERAENIHRLNGRASMIINGDLWSELSSAPGGEVKGVETFIDEHGRMRTRVVWA